MYVEKEYTGFISTQRTASGVIERQAGYFLGNSLLDLFTNTVSDFLVVLNEERQVVYANEALANFLSLSPEKILGLRPGELFGCLNAFETKDGCGSSKFCRTCRSVKAILNSQMNKTTDIQECCIFQLQQLGRPLNLRIRTTPFRLNDENFIIAAFSDTSNEIRKRSLERIFFHDVLNTATGLQLVSELICLVESPKLEKYKKRLSSLTDKLIYEIESQKDLSAAENNEIAVRPEKIRIVEFVNEIIEICQSFNMSENIVIKLSNSIQPFEFISDRTLLRRVLVNMVKNAMEAAEDYGTVTIGLGLKDGMVQFHVHNAEFMPHEVQMQVFQRSFSTKGQGRGLGTYCMKLLSECYLKGSIGFTSTAENGTTFTACFPLKL